jgi:hypothetical protein
MAIKDILDDVVAALPDALDILGTLAGSLPAAEGAAVRTALSTIRILLEEGENTADAIRKVRNAYSMKAQALADTFDH